MPEVGSGTSSAVTAVPQGWVVVARRFSSQGMPTSFRQETKQVIHDRRFLQLNILQNEPLRISETQVNDLERQFNQLATQWKQETGMLSELSQKVLHPAYQRIIGMGEKAVPLILKQLQQEPNHWFWALRAITGANPVKPENRGRIKRMTQDWLDWGRDHGYCQ